LILGIVPPNFPSDTVTKLVRGYGSEQKVASIATQFRSAAGKLNALDGERWVIERIAL